MKQLLLIAMGIGVMSWCSMAQSAEALFGAGQHQEEVEGDLEKAIETYQQVLARAGGDRSLAAKAQFRIGMSYEKLGRQEAANAYQSVIRNYGDQDEAVRQARARLARLDRSPSTAPAFTMRRLEFSEKTQKMGVVAWNASADGRFFGATEYETGNAAIVDVATGEHKVVSNYGNWNNENGYIDQSTISRDGKRIAFWHYKYGATFGNMRVIDADGANERSLYQDPCGKKSCEWGIPNDWSPDGKWVLLALRRHKAPSDSEGVLEILMVPSNGGEPRKLISYEHIRRYDPKIQFSPDGRFVAYDFPPANESASGDLYILSVNGGQPVAVAANIAHDQFLGWTPQGDILFAHERSGSPALYRVPVREGQQAGEPEMLKSNLELSWSIGVSTGGSFFYANDTRPEDALVAELDFASGRVLSEPELVSERYSGTSSMVCFSPDGTKAAFLHKRPGDRRTIVIRDLASGEEREVLPQIALGRRSRLRWEADGEHLLGLTAQEDQSGLYRIHSKTGEAELVYARNNIPYFHGLDWNADGRLLFLAVSPDNTTSRLVRHNLETGEDAVLYTTGERLRMVTLSPDGRRVAFVEQSRQGGGPFAIRVVTADGTGSSKVLHQGSWTEDEKLGVDLVWTPDGRSVVFVRRLGQQKPERREVWLAPVEGGEPRATGLVLDSELFDLAIHPDGKRISFTTNPWNAGEYWALARVY